MPHTSLSSYFTLGMACHNTKKLEKYPLHPVYLRVGVCSVKASFFIALHLCLLRVMPTRVVLALELCLLRVRLTLEWLL